MKDFFKYVGATVVGLIIFGIIATAIGIMSIVGMVASGQATKSVDKNSVLVLKLDGVMNEQSDEGLNLLGQLNNDGSIGLREMLSAIGKAKTNDNIEGIYLEAGALGADMAQLQELRDALADFKKSGKWIIAYGEVYSQGSYYVASLADKIYMNPSGEVNWHGIGGELRFIKDFYAKVGVKVVPLKVGKYKSATEIFTEDKMSEPSRQQTERYIGGWWQTMCQSVAKSRGISIDSLNTYADRLVGYEDPKNLVKYKMIDGLLYNDQVKDAVKKQLKLDKDESISQVSVADMGNVPEEATGDEVAVYYAYGSIVDERSPESIFNDDHQIVADEVCSDLADLADDDEVKAVVIRVNSGGGSAYASEQIWRAVELLKKKKPVVVSMGGAAASGGYYMSSGANYIFAEPTTITGSIGIFGLVADVSELMTQKLGFKFDEVKTNRNATLGAVGHPMTPEQIGYIQGSIDRGYKLFKSRVSQGRRLTMAQVEENAQGHVFLGSDALKLKLVDELGGIDKAVAKAAGLAKLKEYYAAPYPAPKDMMTQIMEGLESSKGTNLDGQLRTTLGTFYEPFMLMRTVQTQSAIQARMPFIIRLN
jgi:protease-4